MPRKTSKIIRRGEQGQALVELALILPLMFLLLFGIIEFGRAFFQKNMTINAARDAVRFAVVQSPWNNSTNTAIQDRAINSITMQSARTNATVVTSPPTSFTNISTVTVTVTTKFNTVLPNFFNPLPNNTDIVGSATMRYEK